MKVANPRTIPFCAGRDFSVGRRQSDIRSTLLRPI
jgi:hypothetical protein